MKKALIITLIAGALAVVSIGCKKDDEGSAPATTPSASAPAGDTAGATTGGAAAPATAGATAGGAAATTGK